MRISNSLATTGFVAALGLVGLCAAPAALATATASATITTVTWTLTDLNLSDGITPSIAFVDTHTTSYGSLAGGSGSFYQSANGINQPIGFSANNAYGSIQVSTGSNGGTASAQLVSSMVASNRLYSYAYAQPFDVAFTLSANTLVSFSTTYAVAASTTIGRLADNDEYALARVSISLNATDVSGVRSSQLAERYISASWQGASGATSYTGASGNGSGTVDLFFANRSASTITGYVDAIAYSDVDSNIAAVPETNPLVLMWGGLGVLGLVLRRRPRRD